LGGHLYVCPQCEHKLPVYNPCGNRHCPNCQALDQERWIAARQETLLPVGHHHVVFTLPAQLRSLALRCPRQIYGLLFDAAAETLTILAKDVLDARLGITAVLHTWRRDLGYHPHLHCIVTAGGLSSDGTRWIERLTFLFPVATMKALFRRCVLEHLHRLHERDALGINDHEWNSLLQSLPSKRKWVIYIEPPFGRSTHVLQYLGRYTHRVAISDARLVSADENSVRFSTRDGKVAQLPLQIFVARFLLHVLPNRFHKIRHFGLYAPGDARRHLDSARLLLGPGDATVVDHTTLAEPPPILPQAAILPPSPADGPPCPRCAHHSMIRSVLPALTTSAMQRAPP
jgi:hypothetical protein